MVEDLISRFGLGKVIRLSLGRAFTH